MRILQKLFMDEYINSGDTLFFKYKDRVFTSTINSLAQIETHGMIYDTLSQWTRSEIKQHFGITPRYSAWKNVWHRDLMIPINEIRSPPNCIFPKSDMKSEYGQHDANLAPPPLLRCGAEPRGVVPPSCSTEYGLGSGRRMRIFDDYITTYFTPLL